MPNNFHELRSCFCEISLSDEISFERSDKINHFHFNTNDKTIPVDSSNTVIKALDTFEKLDKSKLSIFLNKQIPHEAGLGGGSGNAATIFKIINEEYKLGYNVKELMAIGAKIGSDIPFFIEGGICDVKGRGEIVTPLNIELPYEILIIKPNNVSFSTKQIYENYKPFLNSKSNVVNLENFYKNPSKETIIKLENDLEKAIDTKLITDIKSKLIVEGAFFTSMTGSGSAVFGLFDDIKKIPEFSDCKVYRAHFIQS